LDDTETIIDGGKIITGSIDANRINANTISGSNLTISKFSDADDYAIKDEIEIIKEQNDGSSKIIRTEDAAELPLLSLLPIVGKTTQEGAPTPTSPKPILGVKSPILVESSIDPSEDNQKVNESIYSTDWTSYTSNGLTFTKLEDG